MLSIIIPVYNTDIKHFTRCIESVMYQKLPNKSEIIVVDDGSSFDKAVYYKKICDVYGIKLFNQENHGVSAARNLGLNVANGEYIMFVDSDDTIESIDYDYWISFMREHKIDVISGCVRKIYNSRGEKCLLVQGDEEVYIYENMSAIIQQILTRKCAIYPELENVELAGPVCKIYSKNAIKTIRFDESLKIGEDLLFNIKINKEINKICIVNRIWYNYFIGADTASHSISTDLIDKYSKLIETLNDCCDGLNEDEKLAICYRAIYHFNMVNKIYICQSDRKLKSFIDLEKKMLDEYRWKQYFISVDLAKSLLGKKYKFLVLLVRKRALYLVYLYYWLAKHLNKLS